MNGSTPLFDSRSSLPVIADIHLHTTHSHAQNSTSDMYAACVAKGLQIIGFSEHSPRPKGYVYPSDYQEKLTAGFPSYIEEVLELRRKGETEGRTVLLGLELDYLPEQEAYAEALCKAYPFDYIIGGLHFQGKWGFDFTADDWIGKSLEEQFAIFEQYYKDLARLCRTGLFQIAAHPDLVKIFSIEAFRQWLDSRSAVALITEALLVMKEHGVIMELSSAGLRKPCNEIYPGPRIMGIAAQLELPICFSSDAHCVNTPAYAFAELARYAASFGYSESCVVSKGQIRKLPFSVPSLL